MEQAALPESRFAMWRTVVALIHADGVVSPHEIYFIREYTKDVPMSAAQKAVIHHDIKTPQNIYDLFSYITQAQDKQDFFILARILCWSDGDFQKQEKAILSMLEHISHDEKNQALLQQSQNHVKEIMIGSDSWTDQMSSNDSKLSNFLSRLKRCA